MDPNRPKLGCKHIEYISLKRGCRVDITRNLDIQAGLFNGSTCYVREVHGRGIELDMWHGGVDTLTRRYDYVDQPDGTQKLRGAYDLKVSYAMTVHKAEGMTLNSAIIIFEPWSVPAWGYTAVSRLRVKSQMRTIGVVSARHFYPRRP